MKIEGYSWKFGKNVDTDAIIPAVYCNITDPKELGSHCMEGLVSDFAKKISKGDIIIADSNFGCGSSREVAPLAIKAAGIGCVIAVSFARIFFRNAINIGLPIFECQECFEKTDNGDRIEVEPNNGIIRNLTRGWELEVIALPEFIQKIVDLGGLMNYVVHKLMRSPNSCSA